MTTATETQPTRTSYCVAAHDELPCEACGYRPEQENEILEILGDPFDGRIGTQFVGDEIVVMAGIRSADLTRRIVMSHNAHDKLVEALQALMVRFEQTGEAWMSDPAMVTARAALALTEVRQ